MKEIRAKCKNTHLQTDRQTYIQDENMQLHNIIVRGRQLLLGLESIIRFERFRKRVCNNLWGVEFLSEHSMYKRFSPEESAQTAFPLQG